VRDDAKFLGHSMVYWTAAAEAGIEPVRLPPGSGGKKVLWKEAGMAEIKRHDNRLGLWGWIGGGRWGAERYAYILHRITGLGHLFYF